MGLLGQPEVPASGGLLAGMPSGMIRPGNIDLMHRPIVRNSDGSISTVRSMSTNIDGVEVLLPTVSEDGRIMSDQEAIRQFIKSGRHLGMFTSPDFATKYAEDLHKQQEQLYTKPGS